MVFLTQVANKWMRIGDELEIPPHILDNIKANWSHQADPLNFIREVFAEWKKRECSPYNWKTVLVALSSESVGERAMAASLAETLRREKTVQQTKRTEPQLSGKVENPSSSSRHQQPSHMVSTMPQKRRRDDREESSGSDRKEPRAKRMEKEVSALSVPSSSGGSSGELLSIIGYC